MIVCIGAFDGYHRGHFSLFRQAREMAARAHTEWKIVTFSPHPRYVLGGQKARLFTLEDAAFLRRNFDISPRRSRGCSSTNCGRVWA